MSQAVWSDKKILIISIAAAAVTVIAGILHLMMVPRTMSRNPLEGVLFLVGGILQVFWALPVMKRWGRVWQLIGIAGTVVFFLLWLFDRLHFIPEGRSPQEMSPILKNDTVMINPQNIQGPEGRPSGRPSGGMPFISGTALPIEITQILFIGLYVTLAKMISNRTNRA